MLFNNHPLDLLVIEDNEGDFILFEAYLQQTKLKTRNLYRAAALREAENFSKQIDIAFLDLSLPDSGGIESFTRLNKLMPNVPIVVLSGLSDEEIALQCISLGAQDYLPKNDLNEKLLEKSVYYSIERKKNLQEILQVNQQYKLIGKVTNDVIWRWDFETNEITSPVTEFFDYSCDDVKLEFTWWLDKVHPEDKEQILSIVQQFAQGELEKFQAECRFRCADGSYRHIFNRAFLLRNEHKKPYALVGAMMDVTERHQLQQELLQQQVIMQQQIIEATIAGQEKEKEAIGKELHDNINQVLASVKLFLDTAISNEHMKDELLVKSRDNTIYAIDQIRKLSHSLVPPTLGDHGLLDAINELIEELNMVALFKTYLTADDFEEDVLDSNKKIMLYRIVQEQMNNIIKYSKADEVFVALKMSGNNLLLTISDNGVGFDTTKRPKGIGLKNIESRISYYSGSVQIFSHPGKGTTLEVTLPVTPERWKGNAVFDLHAPGDA